VTTPVALAAAHAEAAERLLVYLRSPAVRPLFDEQGYG
jgi:hypothetical protein